MSNLLNLCDYRDSREVMSYTCPDCNKGWYIPLCRLPDPVTLPLPCDDCLEKDN